MIVDSVFVLSYTLSLWQFTDYWRQGANTQHDLVLTAFQSRHSTTNKNVNFGLTPAFLWDQKKYADRSKTVSFSSSCVRVSKTFATIVIVLYTYFYLILFMLMLILILSGSNVQWMIVFNKLWCDQTITHTTEDVVD